MLIETTWLDFLVTDIRKDGYFFAQLDTFSQFYQL